MEDQVDHVRAYFGMRKISLGRIGGEKNLRPLLNDKFVFHMGMLDQVIHLSPIFFQHSCADSMYCIVLYSTLTLPLSLYVAHTGCQLKLCDTM